MAKRDKKIQREIRRLREQDRKKSLYVPELGFEEKIQKCADDTNKALEYLFEEKLVRAGTSAKMKIEGEDKEEAYILLMFPSSVWKYVDKKLQLKTNE